MKKTRAIAFILCVALVLASAALVSCAKKTSFTLRIIDKDGKENKYTVKTDDKTVGDALITAKYLPADSKDAGIFDTLNNIKADYSVDQSYWMFEVNGKVSDKGVFDVDVKDGDIYTFTYTIFEME